jgi:hypothetical protein
LPNQSLIPNARKVADMILISEWAKRAKGNFERVERKEARPVVGEKLRKMAEKGALKLLFIRNSWLLVCGCHSLLHLGNHKCTVVP